MLLPCCLRLFQLQLPSFPLTPFSASDLHPDLSLPWRRLLLFLFMFPTLTSKHLTLHSVSLLVVGGPTQTQGWPHTSWSLEGFWKLS